MRFFHCVLRTASLYYLCFVCCFIVLFVLHCTTHLGVQALRTLIERCSTMGSSPVACCIQLPQIYLYYLIKKMSVLAIRYIPPPYCTKPRYFIDPIIKKQSSCYKHPHPLPICLCALNGLRYGNPAVCDWTNESLFSCRNCRHH